MHDPLSILLVDDHHETLVALSRLLRMSGYDVTCASSYAEALLCAYTRRNFDLYLLDVQLPDGDGAHLLYELRAIQPAPTIAMSGVSRDDEPGSAAGFEQWLTKPCALAEIRSAIEQARTAHLTIA